MNDERAYWELKFMLDKGYVLKEEYIDAIKKAIEWYEKEHDLK